MTDAGRAETDSEETRVSENDMGRARAEEGAAVSEPTSGGDGTPWMRRSLAGLGVTALVAGLLVLGLNPNRYLVFHTSVELFSIAVAFAIFMMAWNARHMASNDYLLFIGLSYGFVSILDLVHTMAFRGMGVFVGMDSNPPTQLWIAARSMQALVLLISPVFLSRKLRLAVAVPTLAAATAALLFSILHDRMGFGRWPGFPHCYVEGQGLTPFKVNAEYVICAVLLAALGYLCLRRRNMDPVVFRFMVFSILATVASEVSFTSYVSVYGSANLLGHLFKIAAFYFIYRAIVQTGLMQPYRMFFRDLELARAAAENEKRLLAAVMGALPVGVAITDERGGSVRFNKAYDQLWRGPRPTPKTVDDYAAYKAWWPDSGKPVAPGEWASALAMRTGETVATQAVEIERFDGTRAFVLNSAAPVRDVHGAVVGTAVAIQDITDLQIAQKERETTVEFLRLVNESRGTRDLVREATKFFQEESGCEAVGIRLKLDDDYPYWEARGFPKEFLLLEDKLCRRDSDGQVVRDSAGNPVIECMCGNVIAGRFDPSKPFFTENGSFWSNCTTDLLASTTEADRQARTRNRCNGEGYESVALVPLRVGKERLGLLQLNDKRKGMFSPEAIASWERLADHLAVALAKAQAEEELQESRDELETKVRERTAELDFQRQRFHEVLEMMPAYVVLLTPDYHVPFANRFFEERFGKSNGRRCYEYLFNRTEPCETCETYTVLKTGAPHHWEWTGPDGRTYDVHDFPFKDADGSPLIMEMGIDITERKQAETGLRSVSLYARGLIEASLDPLFTIDPEGKITDVNAATEAATGRTRAALIGTDFSEYFTEPDKARTGYEQVFREGFVRDYPLDLRHRDGQVIPVLYNATVYRGEDGQVVGVFAAARDITERKRAEAVLKEMNESLEQRVADRTAQLSATNDELTRFNRAAVGRELRMVELKKQVNDLCRRAGQPPPYRLEPGDETRTPPA